MALGVLSVLFIVLIVIASISQYLLYRQRDTSINLIFMINTLLGIFLSWMTYTSLPTNYLTLKMVSLIWGLISLITLALAALKKEVVFTNKILLSIAIFGGFIQLFFI